eukprot:augustus_masked-scaffold_25-processed-gene-3.53-mRNA-1 protein AED:1.00 eAED:1.00 QI:0/0/0/0/1/1/3/0/387
MGWKNTPVLFFDRIINQIIDGEDGRYFAAPGNEVVAWLDDLFIYANTFKNLLEISHKMLECARKLKVRFNLRKCGFSEEVTVWCGREVRQGLWNYSPKFFEKILSLSKPKYPELKKPFAYFANLKCRKLAEVEKDMEPVKWNDVLEEAYEKLKLAIVEASKRFLSTYDHKIPLLLFTDTSQDTWSLALFQDELEQIDNDVRALRSRPLMFLSGGGGGLKLRDPRVGYLLHTHSGGIFVYTDHRALLSVIKIKDNEKKIYWDRLYHSVIRLQSVDLTIFHIPSRDNFVSDLLKRWGKVQSDPTINVARCSHVLGRSSNKPVEKAELWSISCAEGESDPVDFIKDEDVYIIEVGRFSFYDELERETKIVVITSKILERKEEHYQFKEAV